MNYLVLYQIFCLPLLAQALQAYDCEVSSPHQSVYDIREPEPCPELSSKYHSPENISIQIFQEMESEDIRAKNCLITLSHKVTRCGVDSISYGSQWVVYERMTELTPGQCRSMHELKQFTFEGRTFPIELASQNRFLSFRTVISTLQGTAFGDTSGERVSITLSQ